jgi:hypothetical protein
VIRGGSWNNKPTNVRSANRNRNMRDNRNNNLGFRLAQPIRAQVVTQNSGIYEFRGVVRGRP